MCWIIRTSALLRKILWIIAIFMINILRNDLGKTTPFVWFSTFFIFSPALYYTNVEQFIHSFFVCQIYILYLASIITWLLNYFLNTFISIPLTKKIYWSCGNFGRPPRLCFWPVCLSRINQWYLPIDKKISKKSLSNKHYCCTKYL